MDSLKWRVPESMIAKFFNVFTLILYILAWVYAIILYFQLPGEIPIHFNLKGEADGWGRKGSIFLLPLVLGSTILIGYLVGRFSHLFHTGKLTKKDQQDYKSLNQNIAMINFILSLFIIYSLWMTERKTSELSAFEPWSFYIFFSAIGLIVFRLMIQAIRGKRK